MDTEEYATLKRKISYICRRWGESQDIDHALAFKRFITTEESQLEPKFSPLGEKLNERIREVSFLWMRIYFAILLVPDPYFFFRLMINFLLGDERHAKFMDWIQTITTSNGASRKLPESLQFSSKDYDFTGSMYSVILIGLIEDYFRELQKDVEKIMEGKLKQDNIIEFRNCFYSGSLLAKFWVIMEELGIDKTFVTDILEQEGCSPIIQDFKTILGDRHKIAHTGRFKDYSAFYSEVERFKTLFEEIDFLEKAFGGQDFPKVEIKKVFEKIMPFILFIFLHYFKVLPLLMIIDTCVSHYRNIQLERG